MQENHTERFLTSSANIVHRTYNRNGELGNVLSSYSSLPSRIGPYDFSVAPTYPMLWIEYSNCFIRGQLSISKTNNIQTMELRRICTEQNDLDLARYIRSSWNHVTIQRISETSQLSLYKLNQIVKSIRRNTSLHELSRLKYLRVSTSDIVDEPNRISSYITIAETIDAIYIDNLDMRLTSSCLVWIGRTKV